MKRSKLVSLIAGLLLTALASWGMDLSKSSLANVVTLAQHEYQKFKTQAGEDTSKLFIQHLESRSPSDWPYFLDEAFKDQLITPQDLFFIVRKTSFASAIDENGLYNLAILKRLAHVDKMATMVKLLAAPEIALKRRYFGPEFKVTLLVALLEQGYIEALTSIINTLADIISKHPDHDINPFKKDAVLVTTMVDDPENLGRIYNGKKASTESLSFNEWLMREEASHLFGDCANPNYIKAAQAMLLYAEKCFALEMSPIGVKSLASFCHKKGLLPASFDFVSFAAINEIEREAAKEDEQAATAVAEPIACAPQALMNPTPNNTPDGDEGEPFYERILENLGNLLTFSKR